MGPPEAGPQVRDLCNPEKRMLGILTLLALAPPKVDFATQVEPLLREKCYGCHGAAQQMSGLRLDQKPKPPVVIAGKSDDSKLTWRITGTKGLLPMPPAGKRLSA